MTRAAWALALAIVLGGCVIKTEVPEARRTPPPSSAPAPAPRPAPAPEKPAPPPPAPAPAPAPTAAPIPAEFSQLPVRAGFEAKGNIKLEPGFYRGDFRLGASQATLEGAGKGKTVIEGNLFIKTQSTIKNMTVLGKVIFQGNQNDLKDVDFRGGIDDKGVQNRYQ